MVPYSWKALNLGPYSRELQESRNIRTQVGMFLLYSYYVLGVPYFGVPILVALLLRIRGQKKSHSKIRILHSGWPKIRGNIETMA